MSNIDQTREQIRAALQERAGARSRKTWHLDAMYGGGRMFLIFDGTDLVGKWPAERVRELREAGTVTTPFMAEEGADTSRWSRVPLRKLATAEQGVDLALESLAFVHTPEGAPKKRSTRAHR